MTFPRYALIVFGLTVVFFSAMEFFGRGSNPIHYSAGVVVGGVAMVTGINLIIVGLLLLVRRVFRGTSNWPYWCGTVLLVLTLLIVWLATLHEPR